MKRLGRWMLGVVAAVVIAGATVMPADAQVVVRVGPRHYHHHHRHVYYRHGHRYYR